MGIAALKDTSIEWHVAFTSPSQEGIRAAVLAGLGATVQMRGDLKPGMRVLDGQYGLPPLPKADFTLIWSSGDKTLAAREFGHLLVNMSEPLIESGRPRKRAPESPREDG